jgi:hypothetical protein
VLSKICPEIEKFYNALIGELNQIGKNDSINKIEQSDLYQIACEYFDNNPNNYTILTKEFINDENLYRYSQTKRRMLVGNILKKYIQRVLPAAMNHTKIKTSKDELLKKYNKIKNKI